MIKLMLNLLEPKSNYLTGGSLQKKISSDSPNLGQLLLVKEFKRCIKLDVNSFLDEKEVKPLEKAARSVDGYTFTHKISFVNRANPWKPLYPPSGPEPSTSLRFGNSNQNTSTAKPSGENKGHNPLSQPICIYYKQSDHIVPDCPVLKGKVLNLQVLPLSRQST